MQISLVAAFMAGMVSLLSPCVLPLLPTYFAFLGGNSESVGEKSSSQWVLLRNSCFFLSGFTLVFVIMGASASFIGQLFFDYQDLIRKTGAIFMILMGIQLTGLLTIPALQQERRPLLQYSFRGPIGSFLFGVAVTTGWTPCIGPILASILMYASTEEMVQQGAVLLFVYAMGFCLPFILLAFLYNKFLFRFSSIYSWLPWIQRISGIAIILVGIGIYFNWINVLLSILVPYTL
ncbi:MAG: cytochrome c biogenesis protein CcdA [Sporomusaceae bacterium]|nr:cytochrome c biogenesis protein CcdA [Sporomusaceae bacterium]